MKRLAYLRIELLLFFIFMLCCSTSLFSQITFRGKIVDSNGEPAIGAYVIPNIGKGSVTQFDGTFSLELREDSITIVKISSIGFATIEYKIDPNKVKNKIGVLVTDYIDNKTLNQIGESDADGAIRKITGVSKVGNFITVRGLADRYVKTTINGSRIPTLDPFTNNIRLDAFPTSLIESIVITKTASANLPGDWSGAYISIDTKEFPDKLSVNVSTSFGYNDQSTFKEVVSSERSSTDWLGFDSNRGIDNINPRDFPGFVENPSAFQKFSVFGIENYLNSIGVTDQNISGGSSSIFYRLGLVELGLLAPAQLYNQTAVDNADAAFNANDFKNGAFRTLNQDVVDFGQSLNNNWATTRRTSPLDLSQSFSIGNQTKLFGKQLGFLVGFRRSSSIRYDSDATINRARQATITPSEEFYDQEISRETNNLSALINLSYKISDNHSLSFGFMPNLIGINNVRKGVGFTDRGSSLGSEFRLVLEDQFYEERKQLIYQFRTKHYFPKLKNLTADYSFAYTDGSSNSPDFRNVQYNFNPATGIFEFNNTANNNRFFRSLNEDLLDTRLNFELPLANSKPGLSRKLLFGGAYQSNTKQNEQYIYTVNQSSTPPPGVVDPNIIPNGDLNAFFSLNNFQFVTGENGLLSVPFYYNSAGNDLDFDLGWSNVFAGYVMTDYNINSLWRVSTGLRIETTDIFSDITAYHENNISVNDPRRISIGEESVNPSKIEEISYLPSINVVYKVKDDEEGLINIRGSYSKSIARPSIREIATTSRFDYTLRTNVIGNPDLDIVNIDNLDFRAERYFSNGDNISVSLFYKQFKNHIEAVQIFNSFSWANADDSANVTLINSQTTVTREIDIPGVPDEVLTRSMFGQAPYIINGILGYTADSIRFSATLSYNVQGPKLFLVTDNGSPNVFEVPVHNVNLNFAKKLGKHFNVTLKLSNVLNQSRRRAYDYDEGFILDYDNVNFGRTYTLGVSYKL